MPKVTVYSICGDAKEPVECPIFIIKQHKEYYSGDIDVDGKHFFLQFDGMYFDSECLDGVKNQRELPMFSRYTYIDSKSEKQSETDIERLDG